MILLADKAQIPQLLTGSAFHWDGLLKEQNVISIPDYIESNSDRIRNKYIKFIYDLGNKRISDNTLSESLVTYKGYNLWWMSTLVEKNLVKSPEISDCLKLFALEEILLSEKIAHLIFFSFDKKLKEAVSLLCTKLGIEIVNKIPDGSRSFKYPKVKHLFPPYLKGVVYIIHSIFRFWPLRKLRKFHWNKGDNQVFVFSQFTNFELRASSDEFIYSKYWEILPQFLNERNVNMNVLNNFHFSAKVSDVKTGVSLMREMNQRSALHGQVNKFLYSYVSIKTLVYVLFRFSAIHFFNYRLKSIKKAATPENSNINFWPLIEKEWIVSFKGTVLAENLLFIHLIDKLIPKIPATKLALYLQENNGWERALIYAWKKYHSSPLIGVPHATIRYWDLRYIEDRRLFIQSNSTKLPRPNFIAVNGPVAKRALTLSGYNENELLDVEALRYLDPDVTVKKQNELAINQHCVNVLLCGDIDPESTIAMLECVKEAVRMISETGKIIDIGFTYKSHPVTYVDIKPDFLPYITETQDDLVNILPSFQIMIATDSTTAGVEAYLYGLQVVVFTYPKRINFSPLKDVKGIYFANTAIQLMNALVAENTNVSISQAEPFFWRDRSLPGWSKLFQNAGYPNFN